MIEKQCDDGSSCHIGHWNAFGPLAEIVDDDDDEDVPVTTSSRRDGSHDVKGNPFPYISG